MFAICHTERRVVVRATTGVGDPSIECGTRYRAFESRTTAGRSSKAKDTGAVQGIKGGNKTINQRIELDPSSQKAQRVNSSDKSGRSGKSDT